MPRTQSEQDIFRQQSHAPTVEQPLGGVRQDNPTPPRYRIASHQPASVPTDMRAQTTQPPNNKIPRSQKRPTSRRKTVPITIWLKPGVKAELERVTKARRLSISATGAALLEWALQQDLETQQGALFETVITKLMRERERVFNNRFAALLVRFAVEMGQVRHLVTNLLPVVPGMTEEQVYHMLDESYARSKRNLSRRFPELERDIEKLSQWLMDEREEEGTHGT
jgi:hypothetical protein